jgi:hypothetical protein
MAQFIRPDSNITQSSFTGGFADIDEVTPNDSDYAYSANNANAVLEVGLSDPAAIPASGTCTVRWRIAKTNNGTVNGSGAIIDVTPSFRQGGSEIQGASSQSATGTWTTYEFTFESTSVSDWTDLSLRFSVPSTGGPPANRRGGAISWAEVEIPDPPPPVLTRYVLLT